MTLYKQVGIRLEAPVCEAGRNGGDWASLVAQTVKNPPARQETWV